MTPHEYKQLIEMGFIDKNFGEVCFYSSNYMKPKAYNIDKIRDIMLKQLTDEIDINNCIIVIPVATQYGTNYLWNNRQIVDSHCTHIVDIGYFLDKKGLKKHNGESLLVDVRKQKSIPMLIIDNGVIHTVGTYSNPLHNILYYYGGESKEIDMNIVKDKAIFFSGFALERLKN